MKTLVIATALALATIASPETVKAEGLYPSSAAQLLHACSELEDVINHTDTASTEIEQAAVCQVFDQTFADAYRMGLRHNEGGRPHENTLCLPDGTTSAQRVALFLDFARRRPEYRNEPALAVYVVALKQTFRCPWEPPSLADVIQGRR